MNPFLPFAFGPLAFDTSKVFYARVYPEFHESQQLLQALYQLLWLPGYFGFNWNSLQDCLTDLSWIPEQTVVLEHVRLPEIPETELKIYLSVLCNAVASWKDGDSHRLEVVFNAQDREIIAALLQW
ncbi:MAG: hypothetical protein EOO27_14010 [Comamonadaceae bacterium]|nr:MAG: hypothetical protein EOO27_14010 [Comamonadaceae bacterium]